MQQIMVEVKKLREAPGMAIILSQWVLKLNPDTYPGIVGQDLANFVKGVWTAVPDFSIELLNAGEIEPGLVAHHWLVRGTNTGPGADGSEPTGRSFSFKGASIIQVEGDKIRSDQAYFDRKALDKQLEPCS
jgi:SnoaL-like polyketide cyclase